ncbi:MAG: NADH-quinone oxidoreductase subunit NuoH [Firmicutes bacterium]|nr:NADH-quinone oxidoreductase subunit NuoH [Bacillota bacterium]
MAASTSPFWHAVFDVSWGLVKFLLVVLFMILNTLVLVWLERKLSARIQSRLGPMRCGRPHGWLQLIADTFKLLGKEDIIPRAVDKALFVIAPVVVFTSSLLIYVVIPLGPGAIVSDLDVGMVYLAAAASFTVMGILMAGWGSNSKWSLLGAMRGAAMLVSYEVPMVLAVIAVVMVSGTLSTDGIVRAQSGLWNIVVQPLGFLVFLAALFAELNRVPFDLAEAESELVAGYNVEYSGLRFAFFFLAEYANLLALSAVAVTLYFGGWQGPWLPPFVWFMLKTYAFVILVMWIRWTLPRVRVDQLLSFGWKVLLPAALVNLFATGIYVLWV